ncbi:unnamed protein product, partial [Cylicostephanus goldi]
MSERSAADDFFGIEYLSTQQSPAEKQEPEEDRSDTVLKKTANSTASVQAEETDQLSGTEFLDRAFFGEGLKRHEQFSPEKDPSQSRDFFEENFFKRKPLKDINAGASAQSHLSELEPRSDHHQERAPVRASRKRQHVEKRTKEASEPVMEEFE